MTAIHTHLAFMPAMSEGHQPPKKEKITPIKTPQSDAKTFKRKLLSPVSPPDDDDKRVTPKRKRGSLGLETSPYAAAAGGGPKTPTGLSRHNAPLSERQQLAMIMKMTDETIPVSPAGDISRKPLSPPGVSMGKRQTPGDKKVHKRNERGETPLHLAAIKGDAKQVKKLIKAGADVNVKDFAGWTALHEACNHGWVSVTKQLLKCGANVNVQGLENDTPLHDASGNGHYKLVELLLKHGANPLQYNLKGSAPVDVAASPDIEKLLRKEIHSSSSDCSSIDDARSPHSVTSPESVSSMKDDDHHHIDFDDYAIRLPNDGSGKLDHYSSACLRKNLPKSPESKLNSPRLFLKFQHIKFKDKVGNPSSERPRHSKDPQYKSYSVTMETGERMSCDSNSPPNSADFSNDSNSHDVDIDGDISRLEPAYDGASNMLPSNGQNSYKKDHHPKLDFQQESISNSLRTELKYPNSNTFCHGTKPVDLFQSFKSSSSHIPGRSGGVAHLPRAEIHPTVTVGSSAISRTGSDMGYAAAFITTCSSQSTVQPLTTQSSASSMVSTSSGHGSVMASRQGMSSGQTSKTYTSQSEKPTLSHGAMKQNVPHSMKHGDIFRQYSEKQPLHSSATTIPSSKQHSAAAINSMNQMAKFGKTLVQSRQSLAVTTARSGVLTQSKGGIVGGQPSAACSMISQSHKSSIVTSQTTSRHDQIASKTSRTSAITHVNKPQGVIMQASKPVTNFHPASRPSSYTHMDRLPTSSNLLSTSTTLPTSSVLPTTLPTNTVLPTSSTFPTSTSSFVTQSTAIHSTHVKPSASIQPTSRPTLLPYKTDPFTPRLHPQDVNHRRSVMHSNVVSQSNIPATKRVESNHSDSAEWITLPDSRPCDSVLPGVSMDAISTDNVGSSSVSSQDYLHPNSNRPRINLIDSQRVTTSLSNVVNSVLNQLDDELPVLESEDRTRATDSEYAGNCSTTVTENQEPPDPNSDVQSSSVCSSFKSQQKNHNKSPVLSVSSSSDFPDWSTIVGQTSIGQTTTGQMSIGQTPTSRSDPCYEQFMSGTRSESCSPFSAMDDSQTLSPKPDKTSSLCKELKPIPGLALSSSPKVPPLKIIMPQKAGTAELDNAKVHANKHSLPYIVNAAEGAAVSSPQDGGAEMIDADVMKQSSLPPHMQISEEASQTSSPVSSRPSSRSSSVNSYLDKNKKSDKTTERESARLKEKEERESVIDATTSDNEKGELSSDKDAREDESEADKDEGSTKEERRITRSLRSHTAQLQQQQPKIDRLDTSDKTDTGSQAEDSSSKGQKSEEGDDSAQSQKRRLRPKPDLVVVEPPPQPPPLEKPPNPYELHLTIRRAVISRRSGLLVVTPKPPQGYKDYLSASCSYVLHGNVASTLAAPMLSPPNSITGEMRELFLDQEKARYKLRLQHLVERQKLMLSIEQEILRVHGRAARALANQAMPLSVCTILKDEEVYNAQEIEQVEEREKTARSRYNGRQFSSWLQDVDDKFEKIKDLLILRQHHEAESLYAVQKMEWEWRLRDIGICDHNTTPVVDDLHIPMVHVNDEFDLLPT